MQRLHCIPLRGKHKAIIGNVPSQYLRANNIPHSEIWREIRGMSHNCLYTLNIFLRSQMDTIFGFSVFQRPNDTASLFEIGQMLPLNQIVTTSRFSVKMLQSVHTMAPRTWNKSVVDHFIQMQLITNTLP